MKTKPPSFPQNMSPENQTEVSLTHLIKQILFIDRETVHPITRKSNLLEYKNKYRSLVRFIQAM